MRLISSVALVGLMAAMACAASLALGEGEIVKGGIEIKALSGSLARHAPVPLAAKQGTAS
ncbi:MAG TPA: hypothetical protein VKB42_06695 [Dongiaceae bacterium]|nr:hypothetical protein [Dongiaceae bacterium]